MPNVTCGYDAEETALIAKWGQFYSVSGILKDGRTVYIEIRGKTKDSARIAVSKLKLQNIHVQLIDTPAPESE